MAIQTLTDAGLWIERYAFAGVTKALAVSHAIDTPDVTTFGSGYRARAAGLKSIGLEAEGFWDSTVDAGVIANILATSCPVTVSNTASVGAVARVFLGVEGTYEIGAQIGDAFGFKVGTQGNGPVGLGLLMQNGSLSATANGTGQQLGALSASQSLYANVHVLSASGSSPTLDVTVVSDDNSGFTTPTTQATFSQITAAGAAQKIVAGAVTDTYWRFRFVIGGSGPSFAIVAAMGIL
jgi:hypothetical protein